MRVAVALAVTVGAIAASACTSTSVRPVDAKAHSIKQVCIERNPRVQVDDLVVVLENGFARHNIQTSVYEGTVPNGCEYTLWYTARRGWDLAPFLKSAELRLRHQGIEIATAYYNHSGGFALNKWASTETKLDPVIDELLAGFPSQPAVADHTSG